MSAQQTLTSLLRTAVEAHPSKKFVRTAAGDLSYAEMEAHAAKFAGGLAEAGIEAGDVVVLMMRNSREQLVAWFACARLGALHVPINTALVGEQLHHVLSTVVPAALIVDDEFLPQLEHAARSLSSVRVLIINPTVHTALGSFSLQFAVKEFEEIAGGNPVPAVNSDPLAPATLLFTSGTTGTSKACVLSHVYLVRQAQIHARQFNFQTDDVLYTPFPLYHIDAATLTVLAALATGCTVALSRRFSVSRFWDEVRQMEATVFNFMGATLTLLWKADAEASDKDHRVRLAWGVPMPDWQSAFEERFGFPLYQVYGSTDAGVPVYDPIDGAQRVGTCGRVVPEFELRIAASRSTPNAPGEILVRGKEPGLQMSKYYRNPQATRLTIDEAGWLHTGDIGSLDQDGYLKFHGRKSDSIRRRGENISAHEVEQVLLNHPQVLEAAAIGVPSELTEEDVMVCLVLRPGAVVPAAELRSFFLANAPAFMAPRYIEIMDELPKTPTEKVEKFRLRDPFIRERAWDHESQLRNP